MKTLVEYINENGAKKLISYKEYKDALAEHKALKDYYTKSGKKVNARDSKQWSNVRKIIDKYQEQEGLTFAQAYEQN